MKKAKRVLLNIFYPAVVVFAILAVWAVAAKLMDVNLVLPAPKDAFGQFFVYCGQAEFWKAFFNSFWRAVYSFVISFIIAVTLSVAACLSVAVRKILMPFMAIMRSVPTMSIILILVIFLPSALAPAIVAILVVCPTLFSAFLATIDAVDPKLVEMAKVYRVGVKDRIFKLYLPDMAPQLFENCASGFSLNVKLVIAAEALAYTSSSIGKLMQTAKVTLEPVSLFALTLFAMILGVICETVIRLVGRRVVRWQR